MAGKVVWGGRGKRTTFTYRHGSKVTVLFYFRIKLKLHLCYYHITILKIIDGMNAPEHATYQLIRSSRALDTHMCVHRDSVTCVTIRRPSPWGKLLL